MNEDVWFALIIVSTCLICAFFAAGDPDVLDGVIKMVNK